MTSKKTASLALIFPAALAGAFVFAPQLAQAKPGFQIGSACSPGRGDVSKIQFNNQFGVFNESTSSTATVYCPLVYQESDFYSTPWEFQFHVRDQHSSQDISCTMNGLNFDGSIGYSATKKSTGKSADAQYLTFAPLNELFYYSASCSLPLAASGLKSGINEFGSIYLD